VPAEPAAVPAEPGPAEPAGAVPAEPAGAVPVRGFLLDLDGTLVLGDRRGHALRPLPGAVELTRWLGERGVPYRIFTNGTAHSPQEYVRTLRGLGFALADGDVLTPACTAADLFARRGHRRVLALGTGLAGPLREAGIAAVPPAGRPTVDAVLVGLFREFTMAALEAACHAAWQGAAVYSCSRAPFFATAGGRAVGTSRAIAAMISSVTGCRVELVGKPSRHALRGAGRRLGVRPRELAVVGDDPDLEVPMAHRGQALAIAVGTGLGGPDAYAGRPPHRRPHLMVSGVDELLALCRRVEREADR
jgi:HAD superfamily hydrolase (TIGR01450 family)